MFFFKKKSSLPSIDLSWLRTDIHSHLVPGIDDGSPDIETSLKLIKGLSEAGYRKIVTTPHVLWDIYPNTTETIKQGIGELQEAVLKEGLDIELNAAAEYFLDEHFEEELKKKTRFLTISGNMILVEFSMVSEPFDVQRIIFELQMQDYQPVLAHPERYTYLTTRKEVYDDLKNAGCLFQLNLLSLTGYYGAAAHSLARYLLDHNYYDLAGTDMHHERHLSTLNKLTESSLYHRIKEEGLLKNHLL